MSLSVKIPSLAVPCAQAATETPNSLASAVLSHLSGQEPSHMPTVHSLAAIFNISASHLRHVLKQQTGLSFSRHVRILRLRRARQLLQDTCMTVKQVMVEVGMSDHSHFAKDYKKEFGESPTQTRWLALATGKQARTCATK
jgi:AraC-like DNA-binding protein